MSIQFRTAVNRLNTWTFTGLTSNKGHTVGLPLAETELPALALVFSFSLGGLPYRELVVSGATGTATMFADHYLLAFNLGVGELDVRVDEIIDLVDAYLTKVAGDPLLNNALLKPIAIPLMQFGVHALFNGQYYGVKFVHKWEFKV